MRTKAAILSGILALSVPFISSADALSDQLQALIAQVQQLQSQIQTASSTASTVAVTGSCVTLTRAIIPGDTDATVGGEVTKLQQFLKTGGYYAGTVNGQYGQATMVAVQKYQAAQGIVSSGTPGSTGYGSVGPATRTKMASGCTPPPPPRPSACLSITHNLGPGDSDADTGGDVTRLQQFLVSQGTAIYPEARVTGFYGPATQNAVQRFQAAQGILSSGTPDSNGYGYVGAKTRRAMETACSGGSAGGLTASPLTGTAPLAVTFTWQSTEKPASVDYGDGTFDQFTYCQSTGPSCNPTSGTFIHTYTASGTFTTRLTGPITDSCVGAVCTMSIKNIGTAKITVASSTTTTLPKFLTLSRRDQIQMLYIGYYYGYASEEEVQGWLTRMNAGTTIGQVAQELGATEEAKTDNPYFINPATGDATLFLTIVYDRLFDRAPDEGGKAYWLAQLAARKSSPTLTAQIILDIEMGATGVDATNMIEKLPIAVSS